MVLIDRAKKVIEETTGWKFDKVLSKEEKRILELVFISSVAGIISGVVIRQIYVSYVSAERVSSTTGCSSCNKYVGAMTPGDPYSFSIGTMRF